MKTLIIITYYNRKESCTALVNKLLEDNDADIVIFDDHSDDGIEKVFKDKRVDVKINTEHRGKAGFWCTYNDIFAYCKEHVYDYYIIIPDDVYPCDNFVAKAEALYDKAECITLSPLLTNKSIVRGQSRWGQKNVVVYDDYYKSCFFDCAGVMKRDFFEALDWHIRPIKPSENIYKSSGVGKQITLRLQELKKRMCHVKRTLLRVVDVESQMNKEERKRNPMRADFDDNEKCVDVYMASLWRDGHVVKTVKSLLCQPELKSVSICCNNYTDEQFEYVKEKLNDKRITLYRTNNEKKSNEKMRYMYTGTAKYIALVDDDMIYPDYYFFKMIHGCNIHNSAVALHGGVFKEFPLKKYYGGRIMLSWRRELKRDTQADTLGNVFLFFKREFFTKDELKSFYEKAPDVSMDDILLAYEFKKRGIPLYVLAHKKNCAKHKIKKATDNYVYDTYTNGRDSYQVEYINTHFTPDMLAPKPKIR